MTDNNPNIADLSDPNRPTKLAEEYSELYDNEWTDAFEALKKCKKSEDEISSTLLDIIMVSGINLNYALIHFFIYEIYVFSIALRHQFNLP